MARRPNAPPPAGVYMPGAEVPPKPATVLAGISMIGQRRTALPSAAATLATAPSHMPGQVQSETPLPDALPHGNEGDQPRPGVRSTPKVARAEPDTSMLYEWRVYVSPSVKSALEAATDSQEEARIIIGRACATAWQNWLNTVAEGKALLPMPDTKPELLHIFRRRISAPDCNKLFPHYGVKGVGLVKMRMAKGLWPHVDAAILAILAARS
jgi:hypothetical protein